MEQEITLGRLVARQVSERSYPHLVVSVVAVKAARRVSRARADRVAAPTETHLTLAAAAAPTAAPEGPRTLLVALVPASRSLPLASRLDRVAPDLSVSKQAEAAPTLVAEATAAAAHKQAVTQLAPVAVAVAAANPIAAARARLVRSTF